MKKVIIASMIIMMVAGIAWSLTADDGKKLTGKHYNLNIIGVDKDKNPNMDQGAGNVIFVPLDDKIAINLTMGDDFAVLDKNGTDGEAEFQLPDPDLDPYVVDGDMEGVDTKSAYSVFVRPLGKPGGWSTITTCADVVESSLETFLSAKEIKVLNKIADLGGVASVEQVGQEITERTKGKSTFTNVTAELLTIVLKIEAWIDVNNDDFKDEGEITTFYVRVPIFDDLIQDEYWEYDNHDLKILQVRFYLGIETDVSLSDGDWNNE